MYVGACADFLYGFKGAPAARRAVPVLADSVADRDALREFVKRREVRRQELRGECRATRQLRGGRLQHRLTYCVSSSSGH